VIAYIRIPISRKNYDSQTSWHRFVVIDAMAAAMRLAELTAAYLTEPFRTQAVR